MPRQLRIDLPAAIHQVLSRGDRAGQCGIRVNDQWRICFRQGLLERMSGQLGEHHAGELRRESAQAKAERIIAEELWRLGWVPADLEQRTRSAPEKLELAARLRRETTLTIKEIAQRLHLGSWKSATTRLQDLKRKEKQRETRALL